MAVFSSLMPGLREVRAPLVAGYLWLLCAWLLLEPAAPSADGNPIYQRLFELGEAVGPVGWAVVSSVGAYLIGSLLQAAMRLGSTGKFRALSFSSLDEEKQELVEILAVREGREDVGEIISVAYPFPTGRDRTRQPLDSSSSVEASIAEIANRELEDAFRQLEGAVRGVQREFGSAAWCEFGMHERTPIVRIPVREQGGRVEEKEFVIPHLLPSRDLLEQIPLMQTRLLEVAEATGGQVERLRAEAEFRLTVAAPLVVLALIFTFAVSPAWIFALALPAALVVQGVVLNRRGLEELVDALRARSQSKELELITPVFERYRNFAGQLTAALERAIWTQ